MLLDLQGPKLRIGALANGPVTLQAGAEFRLDLDPTPGDATRVPLLHPEIFAALETGTELLVDDGKVRLKVQRFGPDFAYTQVITGGTISDRKGVNMPSVLLAIPAMTPKDRTDLEFGLTLGVDWVALSFVQRPKDVHEVKAIVQGRAAVLEKPAAIDSLEVIVDAADAVMVARGDPGGRTAGRAGAAAPETDHQDLPGRWQARRRCHADARIDDHLAGADSRLGL